MKYILFYRKKKGKSIIKEKKIVYWFTSQEAAEYGLIDYVIK